MRNTNTIQTEEINLVNIWMVTYNHEQFIAQAIESVLMQQTTFPYKIIIGEDCSTDNTRAICIEYQKKHPDKIELLLHKKNLGSQKNSYVVHQACKAKYVAMLEGDDFWTDPLKLQTQVDFMENNPASAACFHSVNYFTLDNKSDIFPQELTKKTFDIHDAIAFPRTGWNIMTSTILYRKQAVQEIPDWFLKLKIGDCTLIMLAALNGSIDFIERVMGAYRVNAGSLMQSKEYTNEKVAQKMIDLYIEFNKHTQDKYKNEIYQLILFYMYQLVVYFKKEKKSVSYALKTIEFNYYTLKQKHSKLKIKNYTRLLADYLHYLFKEVKT